MAVETQAFQLIENEAGLAEFAQQNKNIEWLCFDSEFVGEKRFVTLLCLVQIATEHGFYLIDTLKVKNIQPLIQMIENERILKITHAGENDYRLLNLYFGTIPKNTFDTQIAAGFVGYKYPVSFRRLVESEVRVRLSKSYTVTNWESRPFQRKQLKYALHDVIHLYDLWQMLLKKLNVLGRYTWAKEECEELEKSAYYEQDPHKEAYNSNLIKSLNTREQLFLIRLYAWRTAEARRKNYSKEMILPGKMFNQIIRGVSSGKEALKHNRRLPDNIVTRYGDVFVDLYQQPLKEEEKNILENIPRDNSENPKQDLMMEMLHLLVRYKCLEHNISPNLVMPRTFLKRMKADKNYFEACLRDGWRRIFLGDNLSQWLENRNRLDLELGEGKFEVRMRD